MSDIIIDGRELGVYAEELIIAADSMDDEKIAEQYGPTIRELSEDHACQLRLAVEGISVNGYLNPELETRVLDALEAIKPGNLTSNCDDPNIDYEGHVPSPVDLPNLGR